MDSVVYLYAICSAIFFTRTTRSMTVETKSEAARLSNTTFPFTSDRVRGVRFPEIYARSFSRIFSVEYNLQYETSCRTWTFRGEVKVENRRTYVSKNWRDKRAHLSRPLSRGIFHARLASFFGRACNSHDRGIEWWNRRAFFNTLTWLAQNLNGSFQQGTCSACSNVTRFGAKFEREGVPMLERMWPIQILRQSEWPKPPGVLRAFWSIGVYELHRRVFIVLTKSRSIGW